MEPSTREKPKDSWAEIEKRLQPILLAEPVPATPPKMETAIRAWDWLWTIDDGSIRFSDRLREWLGCSKDEMRDCFHDWMARIHEDDFPEVVTRTKAFFDGTAKRLELEFRLRKNDGEYIRFTTCGHAMKKAGKTSHLYGEYAIHEPDRLQRDAQNLQDMIQAVPCGVSMLDLSGCYVFVNQAFADALGFAPDELIGHAWGDMLHKDDLESVSMAYESMLTDGRSKLTCRVMHRSGTAVDVEMLLAKRRDSENVASGHYCFCRPLGISAAA